MIKCFNVQTRLCFRNNGDHHPSGWSTKQSAISCDRNKASRFTDVSDRVIIDDTKNTFITKSNLKDNGLIGTKYDISLP